MPASCRKHISFLQHQHLCQQTAVVLFYVRNQSRLIPDGALPLIRPESGICTRENIFQFRAELIQFNGKSGEAVVQLVVCGHGT